jgi:hypothetical protein
MKISERLLKKWRQEALLDNKVMDSVDSDQYTPIRRMLNERILRMTQDLLDSYLIERGKNVANRD